MTDAEYTTYLEETKENLPPDHHEIYQSILAATPPNRTHIWDTIHNTIWNHIFNEEQPLDPFEMIDQLDAYLNTNKLVDRHY